MTDTRYGLGRKPSPPDPRDYKMKDYVEKVVALNKKNGVKRRRLGASKNLFRGVVTISGPTFKKWEDNRILDQGNTPHCVGFSWAGWGICLPVFDDYDNSDGHTIYYECKIIDGEPGEENGSYVRSGAKVMKDWGRVGTYFFADNIPEAADYVMRAGPVVLGIDWYNGMFYPDSTGLIKPSGGIAGGHAILWNGVDNIYAYLANSWGTDWGVKGNCKIRLDDLKAIFADFGEGCAATEEPL